MATTTLPESSLVGATPSDKILQVRPFQVVKIIVDKIDAPPGHALSKRDVQEIIARLPLNWRAILRCVHISASRSATAPVLYDGSEMKLTVAGRGRTWDDTLHRFLVELAAHALGFKHRTFLHLQSRYAAEVEGAVGPIYAVVHPILADARRHGSGVA